MYIDILMRIGLNPDTEDDLFKKYTEAENWKIVKGEQGQIVFECKVPRYISELPPELLYREE